MFHIYIFYIFHIKIFLSNIKKFKIKNYNSNVFLLL